MTVPRDSSPGPRLPAFPSHEFESQYEYACGNVRIIYVLLCVSTAIVYSLEKYLKTLELRERAHHLRTFIC